MGDVMKEAAFSLAGAKFTSGDINHMVLQNVNKAQLKVRSKKDNVAGTEYPQFSMQKLQSTLVSSIFKSCISHCTFTQYFKFTQMHIFNSTL